MDLLLSSFLKRRRLLLPILSLTTLLLSACSNVVYKVTGDTLINFGQDKMIPYLLTTDDTRIGCTSGEALTPLMLSFGTVTSPPDELAVLIHMVGGGCAMQKATDMELDVTRLTNNQQVDAARDLRIQAKRQYAIAAQRLYKGYQALVRAMGPLGESCPRFADEQEQLVWILGSVVSLQAVLADSASGSQIGVPKDIAPRAERAAACLDTAAGNAKWWALPKALRGVLWNVVPGLAPDNTDPWETMNEAMSMGEQQGVRLAHALAAIAAYNGSNIALTKDIIRRYVKTTRLIASNPDYQLVDMMARDLILGLSDHIWIDAVGYRTPIGKLGSFSDDKTESTNVDVNVDDLF